MADLWKTVRTDEAKPVPVDERAGREFPGVQPRSRHNIEDHESLRRPQHPHGGAPDDPRRPYLTNDRHTPGGDK
jgi:hypothetical protein